METVAVVLLLIVLGGGALLVGLIHAVVTGSARSDRLRRIELEQERLDAALREALGRVAYLERAWAEGARRAEAALLEATKREDAVSVEKEAPALATALATEAPPVTVEVVAPVAAPEPAPEPAVVGVTEPAPVEAPQPPVPVPVVQADAPAQEAAAPADETPRSEPRPAPSAAPAPGFDWERWVGVRGAAALGACVLVIASLYFFKYSIDNGLLSPAMRVGMGACVGLGGLAAAELRLRGRHAVLANWLAGAGVSILYTTSWFAQHLAIVPRPSATVAMILVTAACGALAMRNDAMVIALLGLVGGFATPVALSTHEDHPIGLFGYLLLLDVALLYLAHKKRWPVLAALSLIATALYQAAWIGAAMGADRIALGMGVLVVFAGAYAVASPGDATREEGAWAITRAGTVLLPFAFGLYFGVRADLGNRLYPLAIMLCVVSAGAAWMGRAKRVVWAGVAAAVASTTTLGAWLAVHLYFGAIPWEAALAPVGIAVVFHAFVELDGWRPHIVRAAPAAVIASLGVLACLLGAATLGPATSPWPWLTGWALVSALAIRQSLVASFVQGVRLATVAAVGAGFVALHAAHGEAWSSLSPNPCLVALAAVTLLGVFSAVLLRRSRSVTDEIATLVPFGVASYFATVVELGPHLTPIAVAVIAAAVAATWAGGTRDESRWIVGAASALGLGALGLWVHTHANDGVTREAWEASLLVVVFAVVTPASLELAARAAEETAPPKLDVAAVLTPIGAVAILAYAACVSASSASVWPWVVGWSAAGALSLRPLARPLGEPLHLVLAVVLGLALPLVASSRGANAAPSASVWLGLSLATAAGLLAASLRFDEARAEARRWSAHGAAVLALVLLLGAGFNASSAPLVVALGATLGLALVAQIVAARLGEGEWSLVAVLACAIIQTLSTAQTVVAHAGTSGARSAAEVALLGQAIAVVVMTAWPLVAGPRLGLRVMAWRAAAVAGPAWFLSLYMTWEIAFGKGLIGVLPVALGLLTLAVARRARLDESTRRSALVWLLGVTVASVSIAIPIQLANEWITVGWALEGVALLWLWRRLDHAGLKYAGFLHLAVVSIRLLANPWVLRYHDRSDVPVLNWLAYTYWVPAACLLGALYLTRDLEFTRARPWEGNLYEKGRPTLGLTSVASAIVVFFVWINLTIFDAFGVGRALSVDFDRLPARDLTLSLAWAIYALFLLAVGMVRRSAALRWTSLALIIVTIGKVFLYDLSHLHDLYRVVSLVGLALSLILISLAYQRFVFGKAAPRA